MGRRYVLSLLDQGLLSAFSLALHVVLVRAWAPADYGLYGYWLAIGDSLLPIANALFLIPLLVHAPRAATAAERRRLESVVMSGFVPFLVAALAGCLVLGLWARPASDGALLSAVAGPAMIGGLLCRSYGATAFFALQRPAGAMAVDAAHVGLACTLLLASWSASDVPGVAGVLLVLAISQATAATAALAMVGRRPRPAWSRWWRRHYAPLWRQARWSLLGAISATVQGRSQVLIVGALVDPAAYGAVLAGSLLAAPPRLAATAWSMVARPRLAEAAGRGDLAAVRRLVLVPALLLSALFLLMGAALVATWAPVSSFLFANYGAEMTVIVGTWMAMIYAFCLGECVSAALQGLHEFRRLAFATVWGSLVSVIGGLAAVLAFGYPWVMLGPLAGQLVALGWMLLALRRSLAELPAPATDAPR